MVHTSGIIARPALNYILARNCDFAKNIFLNFAKTQKITIRFLGFSKTVLLFRGKFPGVFRGGNIII
jgi:hypothetical protein